MGSLSNFQKLIILNASCIIYLLIGFSTYAQDESLFAGDESLSTTKQGEEQPIEGTYEERVKKLSPSRKTLIISNTNKILLEGDYFTILKNNLPVARALTIKNKDDIIGIKIIKLYSIKLWYQLLPNTKIRILKGDDSSLFVEKKNTDPELDKYGEVVDIYDDPSIISEDLDLEENKNRIIKTDNIIGVAYGRIESLDSSGAFANYDHWSFNWSYQFLDNFWAEGSYGQTLMTGFPASDIDAKLTNISLRLKYIFNIPFHSYLMPFVGVQISSATSSEAGSDPSGASSASQLAYELQLIEEASFTKVHFGVSALKRLVPGWFAKIDIGSDSVSLGVALEF